MCDANRQISSRIRIYWMMRTVVKINFLLCDISTNSSSPTQTIQHLRHIEYEQNKETLDGTIKEHNAMKELNI